VKALHESLLMRTRQPISDNPAENLILAIEFISASTKIQIFGRHKPRCA
jgi:hypothetical protein